MGERDLGKMTFQQILGKTFLLLPLSALFKHHSLPILNRRPFESLNRRRIWNASPTKPWLMFKEKIMEIQCQDHTRENRNVFYYRRIWLNNILDVHVLHHCEYWNTTGWVGCILGGDKVNKQANSILMDGAECLIMDARLHAHDFLDKRTVTVLLACTFCDVLLILMYLRGPLFCAYTGRLAWAIHVYTFQDRCAHTKHAKIYFYYTFNQLFTIIFMSITHSKLEAFFLLCVLGCSYPRKSKH